MAETKPRFGRGPNSVHESPVEPHRGRPHANGGLRRGGQLHDERHCQNRARPAAENDSVDMVRFDHIGIVIREIEQATRD
jgi:hypothetical protein